MEGKFTLKIHRDLEPATAAKVLRWWAQYVEEFGYDMEAHVEVTTTDYVDEASGRRGLCEVIGTESHSRWSQTWFDAIDEEADSAICEIVTEEDLYSKPNWYVNVYIMHSNYGGPEEGGWWYDSGDLQFSQGPYEVNEANRIADELRKQYPSTGKRFLSQGGDDYSVRVQQFIGENFPKEVPHYE